MNQAGREIPEELLKRYGKKGYQGDRSRDGAVYQKASRRVRSMMDPSHSKLLSSIGEALVCCGAKDGAVLSFHHHFRDGDFIVNMVAEAAAGMGLKDLTICASSLGAAHDPVARLIEEGVVTGIQSSGVRGRIGEMISRGKLKNPAIIRSHGGRVRAIEEGEVHIDIAFIGASSSDEYGNASGLRGKNNCGVLSYSAVDAGYADHVVVVTDCLVDYPNLPASISQVDVDYVVVVDQVGDPKKIVSNVVRMTSDVRELKMAQYCAEVIAGTPFFKDGFSFQTGGGGAALAVNRLLRPYLEEKKIKMGFAIGGITQPMCELLQEGFVRAIVNAQCFDAASVASLEQDQGHFEITTSEYANPMNKGAYVNRLDYVVLGALEIDTDFNVNVVTGSDGIVRGAPGGHPDTAAGAKCSIIVAPLIRGRIPTVCERVVTVTTPGEVVDVLVTDYGIAVNPRRKDLLQALREKGLPLRTIEELKEMAYAITGPPDEIQFEERVVGIVESRDGTILDVIRQIHPYEW